MKQAATSRADQHAKQGSEPLSVSQSETFLLLWERVIAQCSSSYRERLEAEQQALWLGLPAEQRTKARARQLLSALSRNVDTEDEEGRGNDLQHEMAILFGQLKV
jgi:hypothetical protein